MRKGTDKIEYMQNIFVLSRINLKEEYHHEKV